MGRRRRRRQQHQHGVNPREALVPKGHGDFDWAWLERRWLTSEHSNLKRFAEEHGVPAKVLYRVSAIRQWVDRKRDIESRATARADDLAAETRAREIARMNERHYDVAALAMHHLRILLSEPLERENPRPLPAKAIRDALAATKDAQLVQRLALGADKPDAEVDQEEVWVATVSGEGVVDTKLVAPARVQADDLVDKGGEVIDAELIEDLKRRAEKLDREEAKR